MSPPDRQGRGVRGMAPAVLVAMLSACSGGGERPPPAAPSAAARSDAAGEARVTTDETTAAARERWRPEDRRSSTRNGRVAGYVSLAIGAQASAVALVTSAMMLHSDGVRADNCDADKRCNADGVEANTTLRQLGGWNAGAWALGVTGLAVGTVLLLLYPERPSRAEGSRPRAVFTGDPSGSGAGLGLGGSF